MDWREFVLQERIRLGLSIRDLAKRAGLSPSGLAANLRGDAIPQTITIERLADALGVERAQLLQLFASTRHDAIPKTDLDPEAAYLAKQLSKLPASMRETVIDGMTTLFETMMSVAEAAALEEGLRRDLPDVAAIADAQEDEDAGNTVPPLDSEDQSGGDGQAPTSSE